MDISEATDSLRPGEKYLFLTLDQLKNGLTNEQLGKPEIDGVVVHYRGIDIISIETGNHTYGWHAGGYLQERTLREMIDQIQRRMTPIREESSEDGSKSESLKLM